MELINPIHLNELLQESTRYKYFLSESKGHTGVPDSGDGSQGEYNETFKYYRHKKRSFLILRNFVYTVCFQVVSSKS